MWYFNLENLQKKILVVQEVFLGENVVVIVPDHLDDGFAVSSFRAQHPCSVLLLCVFRLFAHPTACYGLSENKAMFIKYSFLVSSV